METGRATIFTEFLDLLKRLGIDPQGTSWEIMHKERQLMTQLEQIKDFPLDRLPELETFARETQVLNPEALIRKARQLMAQAPKKSRFNFQAWIDKQLDGLCDCERCDERRSHIAIYQAALPN